MQKFKKLFAVLICAATMSITLGACNTISGIGKDVERAGAVVKDAAKR
jgi:predicted small secreted protein